MNKEKLMELLNNASADVDFEFTEENFLDVTINDFEGFDEEWNEISREYVNAQAVENVLDFLNQFNCEGDFYRVYQVDELSVQVGYTSFDI